jgi:hypothetical protein
MNVTYIIDHIHSFLNVPKKSNLLINVSGGSTIAYITLFAIGTILILVGTILILHDYVVC